MELRWWSSTNLVASHLRPTTNGTTVLMVLALEGYSTLQGFKGSSEALAWWGSQTLSRAQSKSLWGHWEVSNMPRVRVKPLVCGWVFLEPRVCLFNSRRSKEHSFLNKLIEVSLLGKKSPGNGNGWVAFLDLGRAPSPVLFPSCLFHATVCPPPQGTDHGHHKKSGDGNSPYLDWCGSETTANVYVSKFIELWALKECILSSVN